MLLVDPGRKLRPVWHSWFNHRRDNRRDPRFRNKRARTLPNGEPARCGHTPGWLDAMRLSRLFSVFFLPMAESNRAQFCTETPFDTFAHVSVRSMQLISARREAKGKKRSPLSAASQALKRCAYALPLIISSALHAHARGRPRSRSAVPTIAPGHPIARSGPPRPCI